MNPMSLPPHAHLELCLLRHAIITGYRTPEIDRIAQRQYNHFLIEKKLLQPGSPFLNKTGRRWGAIYDLIRQHIHEHKTPITYATFCPPLTPIQSKRALTSLWHLGELKLLRPGLAGRRPRPAEYQAAY